MSMTVNQKIEPQEEKENPFTNKDEDHKDWIKVGEYEYDITAFQKRHPGGSVIKYLLAKDGADATETYREFHHRSSRADKVLNTLPKRKSSLKCVSSIEDAEMLKDFAKFRQDLVDKGFFSPSLLHVILRLTEVACMFAAASYLVYAGYTTLAVILFGLFGGLSGYVYLHTYIYYTYINIQPVYLVCNFYQNILMVIILY